MVPVVHLRLLELLLLTYIGHHGSHIHHAMRYMTADKYKYTEKEGTKNGSLGEPVSQSEGETAACHPFAT